MKILNKILLNFFFVIGFLFFVTSCFASEEFDTEYEINYVVNSNAAVTVQQNIILTNKLANIYASQYQISLGTTKIRNIWARIGNETLDPEVQIKDNSTLVKIYFPNKIVGKGQSINLSLGYTSDDYASKNGRVLEIGIPKLADANSLKTYQINLYVPISFEEPIFMSPKPSFTSLSGQIKKYVFNKDQLLDQSIIASFGNFQVFDFILKYNLENKNALATDFELALPPDTPFQKIYYNSILPIPKNIKLDKDGNWIGTFNLPPRLKTEVIARGNVKLFLNPQPDFVSEDIIPKEYLKKLKYWDVDNPEIKRLAQELKTPKEIYKYVVSNLIYDYARVSNNQERLGALGALQNKTSAVCMEFTDLFIAMARSAGIPAREVNGYAYTANPKLKPLSLSQDILHAWPQYFDKSKNLWISVDPTWENTTGGIDFFNKLDLNHFTFVFHGLDSEYPLPAGSYTNNNIDTKNIEISFGSEIIEKTEINLKLNFPVSIISALPLKGEIIIKNIGNTAIYNQKLDVSYGNETKTYKINALPPFSTVQQEITFPKKSLFTSGNILITANFYNQTSQQNIKLKSIFPSFLGKLINDMVLFIQGLKYEIFGQKNYN